MSDLVIHAPEGKLLQGGGRRSFEDIVLNGIGPTYAIYQKLRAQVTVGCKVIVLRKDLNRSRAEGELIKLEPSGTTKNGIQRYDVHIRDCQKVPYRPEKLNHCGVAVI